MTINQTILQHIEAAFQGEVWGIASYRAMMEGQSDPVRRWKWAVLTQLEVETRAAMFDLLRTLGGDTQDREASRQAGLIEAERLLQMDWLTMISAFSADLPGLIAEYSALEKAAQPHIGEATALRKLVQHEKATLAFCEAELAGRDDSLAEVLTMLREVPKMPALPLCTGETRLSVEAMVEDVFKSTYSRADGG